MNRAAPSRFFHRLRHTRIENKGLKALSLALAILFFIISQQPIADMQVSGVRIEYRGLNPGVELGGDVEQTVSVRLSGPRNVVRGLSPNDLLVIADLTDKEPGERFIHLRADESFLPDKVNVVQIEPANIRIRLEPTATKRVKVEAQLRGLVAEGREIYGVDLDPEEIEIEGPQSLVGKIDRLLTETVNLEDRAASFQTSVDVEAPQNSLRVKTPGPIKLSVEIGEERAQRRFNIPVRWPDKSADERLLTKSVEVEVYGPRSAVESLGAGDLRAEIRVAGLPPDADSITPNIQKPANVEVRNIIPREVKVKR
jgi:YbbR domain-containing protein